MLNIYSFQSSQRGVFTKQRWITRNRKFSKWRFFHPTFTCSWK